MTERRADPMPQHALAEVEVLRGLAPADLALLADELEQLHVPRGQELVRQGDPADALYVVVSGRFDVSVAGRAAPLAEIGAGQPIGEIAFLAGGERTATVRALRDSLVLKLGRGDFEALSARSPSVWRALTVTLARRLASSNISRRHPPDPKPRTIALVRAGPAALHRPFTERLAATFRARGRRIIVVDRERLRELAGAAPAADAATTAALNALETANDYVLYVADDELTPWTEKAIRQADLVLSVGEHDAAWSGTVPLNALEHLAADVHAPAARRLVLLHGRRGPITGTARWLAERPVAMHHHVAMDVMADVERLQRFIDGTALGLVACGGGAYCAAHIGLYKACLEAGLEPDVVGGTSGGAAMAAAFAMGTAPEAIDRAIHDIFVTNKAMRRYTWPRYGLLDHAHFDAQLRRHFGGVAIEDLWIPYFAVSTNLSTHTLERHRRGELWIAVRASGAIPGLLPPYFTPDGQMLVDGALLDNVPIQVMRGLKSGPNIVVSFVIPRVERFGIDYHALPSRRALVKHMCNPFSREGLPDAPGPGSVLMRAMMANRQVFEQHLGESDLLMVPPFPDDMGILDWHRHGELMQLAYRWTSNEILRLSGSGHAVFAETLARSGAATVVHSAVLSTGPARREELT